MSRMKPMTVIRWNLVSLFGWANIVLGFIGLIPAITGNFQYFFWGSAFSVIVGGIMVSFGGPLRKKYRLDE